MAEMDVDKCMKTLRTLIRAGYPVGLPRAEQAIITLMATGPDVDQKVGLLSALESELSKVETPNQSASREFIFSLDDFVAQQIRHLLEAE